MAETIEEIGEVEEGQHIFWDETGEVYQIGKLDIQIDEEDGIASGSITLEEATSSFDVDAEVFQTELVDGRINRLNPELIENAEQILIEFAAKEIGNYTARLGINHEYNLDSGIGAETVETIRDIKAAGFISRNSEIA